MLFTISSNGELDHAKFSNYFNDSVMIKPNSFVCLIQASIVEDLNNTIITLPANTFIQLRFDPMNQYRLEINAVETEFSIRELKDRLNTMFSAAQIYINRAFICKVEATTDGKLELHFEYYTPLAAQIGNQNFLRYAYQVNTNQLANEPQQTINYPCIANTTATYANGFENAFPVIGTNGNWLRTSFNSSPGGNSGAVAPTGNPTFLINGVNYGYGMIRNTNRESFNLAVGLENSEDFDLEDQLNVSQFTMGGCPDGTGTSNALQFHFVIGNMTHDLGTNVYTDAPIPGLPAHNSIPIDMTWKGDGRLTCSVRNTTTNNLDEVYNQLYNIGDMYRVSNSLSTILPRDIDNCYMPLVKRYDYQGQVFFLPGSVNTTGGTYGTAATWNTKIVPFNPGINWSYKNASRTADAAINSVDWISSATRLSMNNCYTGCWGGHGYNNGSRGNNLNARYLGQVAEAMEITPNLGGLLNSVSYLEQLPRYKRNPDDAVSNPTAANRNVLDLNLFNGYLTSELPTMISLIFSVYNDTAMSGNQNHRYTLVGGRQTNLLTRGKVIEIAMTNLEAWDVAVYDDLGVATTHILQDSTGARINLDWKNADDHQNIYALIYSDDGAGNTNVVIADLRTTTEYGSVGVPTLNSGRLMNTECLGGADKTMTLTANDAYYSGWISQFKYFAKPRHAAITLADWAATRVELFDTYRNGRDTNAAVMKPVETDIQNPADFTTYANMGDVDIENTNSPLFYVEGLTDANQRVGAGYGTFSDVLFLDNAGKMDRAYRNNQANMIDMTDKGVGLTDIGALHLGLDFDNYDIANQRVVEESLPNFLTGKDNPWFNEKADVSNVALEDEVFNVEITNLPHRSLNGKNHSYDKTIYQLPVETTSKEIQGVKITEHNAEQKVWIPLNNAGDIPISKLDIQISKEDGTKAENLRPDTHLVLQIEQRNDII